MKYIKTFEQYNEDSDDSIELSEGIKRVTFKGKTVKDLYNKIKSEDEVTLHANGKEYSINEIDELKKNLHDSRVIVNDEDGEEYTINVDDIEFINIDESYKSFMTFDNFINERSMLETSITDVVGLKQVRVVIDGPDLKKHASQINKIIDKHSPENDVKFFPATGKMVGNVIKVKLEFITRDLKSIDKKITMVEKPAKR